MAGNRQLQQLVPRGESTWLGYFLAQIIFCISTIGVIHGAIFTKAASAEHNKAEKQFALRRGSLITNIPNVFVFPFIFPTILIASHNDASTSGALFFAFQFIALAPQVAYLYYLLRQVDIDEDASKEEANPLGADNEASQESAVLSAEPPVMSGQDDAISIGLQSYLSTPTDSPPESKYDTSI